MLLLCPRATVWLGYDTYTMACTLRAIHFFESAAQRSILDGAINDLESAMLFVAAMLVTDQPNITPEDVGAADPHEFSALLQTACDLLAAGMPRADEDARPATAPAKPEMIDWRRIWAIGRFDLRLSEDEFWGLAPWQLQELMQRLQGTREESLWGSSMVCAAVFNSQRTSEDQPMLDAALWMPGKIGDAARAQQKRDQQAGLKSKLRQFAEQSGLKPIVTPLKPKK